MINAALTARVATTKRRLLAGGLLLDIEIGTPGARDNRGRPGATTWEPAVAYIEDITALDRASALTTDRNDNTVVIILDPTAIKDSQLLRWGTPLKTFLIKAIDGV